MKRFPVTTILLAAAALSFAAAADDAYLFSYFSNKGDGGRRGEGAGLHLAWSFDGKTWTALNGDRPLLVPEVGQDKLMRDPSIARGPDGTYHLVWTSSWKDRIIGYASSKDLVHWSEQRAIPVMADEPNARNCWAPEVTYNPDDGLFYIYWATTIPGRHSPIPGMEAKESGLNHRIYLTTTPDWKTFSPTKLWFNPSFSAIDAAIVRDEKSEDWIMVVKNENHTPVEKNIRLTRTRDLSKGFPVEVSEPITDSWVEGPSALFVGDLLYVYFDRYRNGRYGAVVSADRGKTWRDVSAEMKFPEGIRHGTAFKVTRNTVEKLLSWDGERAKSEPKAKSGEQSNAGADIDPSDVTMLEIRMGSEKLVNLGDFVRFTGEVKDLVRGADQVQLLLDDWHGSLIARVPLEQKRRVPRDWGIGARLRVSGTLTYRYQDGTDFRIAANGADSVEVLKAPLLWTPSRVIVTLAIFALFTFAAIGWALLLAYKRASDAKVADAVAKERLRLSHDLHDGYQQLLAGCMFRLTAAMSFVSKGRDEKGMEQLEGLRNSLTHAQDELRAALWTMKEEAEGPAAMSELFRYAASRLPQWEGKVFFSTEGEETSVDRRYAGALLMILQEAVGNALRHGDANTIKVKVVFGRNGVGMIVKDDGCGFKVEDWMDGAGQTDGGVHIGLESMRSRTEKLGGVFSVRSIPGKGTEVKVVLRGATC